MAPADFLALSDEALRAVGLSGAKMRYGRSLPRHRRGPHRLRGARRTRRRNRHRHAGQAKGIGRWTAEIYLMFAHGRPDIMRALISAW